MEHVYGMLVIIGKIYSLISVMKCLWFCKDVKFSSLLFRAEVLSLDVRLGKKNQKMHMRFSLGHNIGEGR